MPGVETEPAPLDVAELRPHFRGALVRPGEEGYDDARRLWNGAINRRPTLVARCAGADDAARHAQEPLRPDKLLPAERERPAAQRETHDDHV